MRHSVPPALLHYGAAVVSVAAACTTRAAANPALGDHAPYVLVLLAVILVAWRGGVGPALLTLVLGLTLSAWAFVPPRGHLAVEGVAGVLSLVLHAALGLGVILLARSLRSEGARAALHAEEALRRQKDLEAAAERARRDEEARARLASIVENSMDAIVGLDADGAIVSWNAGAEKLYGYTADEILGLPYTKLLPSGVSGVSSSIMSRLRRGEQMAPYETVRVHKSGRRLDVAVSVSPLKDSEGGLIGFSTIGRDIAERRATERALRDSEARYRLAVRAANDGIWDWDLDAGRIHWSESYDRLFGRRPRPPGAAASWGERVHADDRKRVVASLHAALTSANDYWEAEYRYLKADGSYAHVLDRACILRDGRGRAVRVIGAKLDQTEQKRAAAEQERLYRELCETEERRQAYVLSLAHELRNPLAPILNGLQVLKMAGDDPTSSLKAREMVERQVRHMARLIDSLLEVSRVTAGKVRLKRAWLDLTALARATAEDRRASFEREGLTLTVDVPAEPVWIDGDATRLAQVLSNLLDNSLKFTERGGVTVRLTAEATTREAALSVGDTGLGIDPAVLPRVFDVFAQGDGSLDRSRGGLGLGLALVKGLTELHGGVAEAHSDGPGRGAEIVVRLPYDPEHTDAATKPEGAAPPLSAGGMRVLVVEDHRDGAECLRTLLTLGGHEVQVAHTGTEGVTRALAWRPDVVLTDIGLPGKSGLELARELRDDATMSGALLIAVSGYARDEEHLRGRDWPFDASLTKPVDFDVLQQLLTRLARRTR